LFFLDLGHNIREFVQQADKKTGKSKEIQNEIGIEAFRSIILSRAKIVRPNKIISALIIRPLQ
jgi:hypothetical protein